MSYVDELSQFRNAWKNELFGKCPTKQSKQIEAKQLYVKGMQLERGGYCYEAIEYFRQALRLVPDIEKHIGVNIDLGDSSSATGNLIIPGLEEVEGQDLATLPVERGQWPEKFNTSETPFEDVYTCFPERSVSGTHISALPNEIILTILRYVVSMELDLRSVETFGETCKWFHNLARTPQLWQAACQKIWTDIQPKSVPTSWRAVFINRPHMRFDGVYVSRIKYHRQGAQKPNMCCTLQTVFYHRFLRFFSDGLVLGLNTTQAPQNAVAALKDRTSTNKDVTYGQYTISGREVKIVLFERDTSYRSSIKLKPDQSFNITFKLSGSTGRQVLQWEEYFTVDKKNGLTTKRNIEVVPPHFSKFVYIRAKSYTALSGGTI